jgi:signal transduction histidine kinase
VGDLLFVAQTGGEHPALEPTRVDLHAVAADCLESMRRRADEAGVELVLVGRQVPAVKGDASWLEQVVENLVSNAIKYSADGGRVEVRTTASAGRAVLEVTDVGIGIPRPSSRTSSSGSSGARTRPSARSREQGSAWRSRR